MKKNCVSLLKSSGSTLFVTIILGSFALSSKALFSQTYTDVADSLDVSAIPNSMQYGSGMSFYDFDKDGWDDLSFTMVDDSLVFYRNVGGAFEKLSSFVYGEGQVKHLVWVDYDNDGDLDFGLTTFEGKYQLYQNDGNFNFTDVSEEVGLLQGEERYYGMTFADYDRDGDLDMYVTCYEQLGDETFFSRLNHLYQNNGDGTFTNVTNAAGVGDGIRLSFKGVWFDYNMDGWPDLFVINDRVFKNSLYKNNGDGTFTDVSEEAGIQLGGQDPMTATVGDFDNDGDLDVYMTNTSAPAKRGQLLVNNGDGTFTQSAEDYGLDVFGWTWGAVWVDYDNDTDQDLYVAHGHPNPGNLNIQNFFMESEGGLFFTDITDTIMTGGDSFRSYSNARGDIDNDGFYDIGVLNRAPNDVNIWHNSGNDNHYIKITLTGTASNIMAIGSWIRVYINGLQYTQYTMCGENYIGQNSQHHIFGLRNATVVDSVQVEYVLGHTDTYYNLPADSSYYFTEGDTYTATVQSLGPVTICEGDSVTLDAGEHHQYNWNNGHSERFLTVHETGEFWVTVENEFGVIAHSDTVSITQVPQPFIESEVVQPACFGDSTGWISLENLEGVPPSVVEWNNGMNGAQIDGLPAGMYEYTFTDSNGCVATSEVLVQQPMLLSVLVFTFPETNGNDGSISLVINGGESPYTVLVDSVEYAETVIDGLQAGTYAITIIDGNGCVYMQEVVIQSTVSMLEMERESFVLFPNPLKSGGQLAIQGNISAIESVQVFNAISKEIHSLESLHQQSGKKVVFDLPSLQSGMYFLQIVLRDGLLRTYPVLVHGS